MYDAQGMLSPWMSVIVSSVNGNRILRARNLLRELVAKGASRG